MSSGTVKYYPEMKTKLEVYYNPGLSGAGNRIAVQCG